MQKRITEWRRYLAMWIAWVSLESADTTVATDVLSIKVAVELAVAVLVLACETTEVAEWRALARWLGLVANQGSRALTHIHTQSREHWPLPSSSKTVTDQGGGEITDFFLKSRWQWQYWLCNRIILYYLFYNFWGRLKWMYNKTPHQEINWQPGC